MTVYADSRKWWNEGWVDYMAPQIYWPVKHPANGFEGLVEWWEDENKKGRHLWPGVHAGQVPPADVVEKIWTARGELKTPGTLQFSIGSFMKNPQGLNEQLKTEVFARHAKVPASTWLDKTGPAALQVQVDRAGGAINWKEGDASGVKHWCVYREIGGEWSWTPVAADQRSATLAMGGGAAPTAVAVTAMDRFGNESARGEVRLKE